MRSWLVEVVVFVIIIEATTTSREPREDAGAIYRIASKRVGSRVLSCGQLNGRAVNFTRGCRTLVL